MIDAKMDSNTKNTLQNIWHAADQNRGASRSSDIVSLLRQVAQGQIDGSLTPDVITALLRNPRQRREMGEHFSALTPSSFIAALAAQRKPRTILDPTCGSGFMLYQAVQAAGPETADGVEINPEMHAIAERLLESMGTIRCGDFFDVEQDLLPEYDLIIADAPLGQRGFLHADDESAPNGAFARELSEAIAFWACDRLSSTGLAAIVVTGRLTWDERFRDHLHKRGGRIVGFLHMAAGTMLHPGLSTNLMLIDRGTQGPVFVAELNDDPQRHQHILSRLRNPDSRDSDPSTGMWCELSAFRGYKALESNFRLNKRLQGTHYAPVTGSQVFQEIRRLEQADDPQATFDADSGDLLIDRFGRVYADLEELPAQRSNVLRVRLNTECVDRYYFRHWLQTDIGQLSLQAVATGSVMPMISLHALRTATFYLPDLSHQRQFADVLRQLETLEAEIEETRYLCWEGRSSPADVAERIARINRIDTYEDWIESLPYPLASILWRHKTAPDSAIIRAPILSHFFEAMAALVATIHLSAFMSDDDEWASTQPDLLNRLHKANLSLERATFGTWKCICESLGKIARGMLKNPDRQDLVQILYRLHHRPMLESLLSSELVRILSDANGLRNTHLGHAGAMGEREATHVEERFVALVQEVRSLFGLKWRNYELVQGGKLSYRDGRYELNVPLLMGTRSQFTRVRRTTTSPLEEGGLYFLGKDESVGLKLLPLMRMAASPSTELNACYFFNRTERNHLRFVSYHFEQSAELKEMFADTKQALERISHIPSLPGQEDEE